ncbi:MAG: TonB family protein [Deltaproteobacteria bacterium]|nr:TonB family protein [Deltaproteobacteria bacterium]
MNHSFITFGLTAALLIGSQARAQEAAPTAPTPAPAPTDDGPAISKMPELERFVEAEYPARAAAARIEAIVILEIDINAAGGVDAVRVIEPAAATGYGFDEAATLAASKFEFSPAEAGGTPIPVTISYKYGFKLKDAPPPAEPAPHVPVLSFSGLLLERGTRAPLAGATVTVFQGEGESAHGLETTSDNEGRFSFFDLTPGEWKVLCDPEGYFPVRTAETVAAGEVVEVVYHVEKRSYSPFDVMVEARRPKKEVTRRTVTTEEIEKIPGTFGDPIAVVTNLPSVAHTPFGSGALIVRGSSPADTIINVDGTNVPYLYHFGGIRTAIPAGMLQYLDFYPGNFSPYFGRATGGVLDVKLKRLQPEKANGYIDASFLDTGVFFSMPLGDKAAIAIGGRRSYLDVLMQQVIPKDGPVTLTAAPRYYDYQLMASWRPTPDQELSLIVFGSDDRFAIVFNNPADAAGIAIPEIKTASRFYRGILSHRLQLAGKTTNELKLTLGWDEQIADFGPGRYIHQDYFSPQLRDTASFAVADALQLKVGLDWLLYNATWDVSFRRPPMEGDSIADNNSFDTGGISKTKIDRKVVSFPAAFVEAEWTPIPEVTLLPGVRVDYFDWIHETVYDPRLTARWRLSATTVLKGGAGVFHQAPQADQVDQGFGNPDVRAFWAYHYSLGAEHQPLSFLNVDVTAFYKDVRDVVVLSDALIERGGVQVPERYNNNGRGRVYGMDLLVRHEFANGFFGWLAYTLSRSERRDNRSNGFRRFDYDQTHILTALGSYRLPHNWEVGGRWRYVSGNPYTPVVGSKLDLDADTYQPVTGKVNSARLPAFHQLDLRIDKRFVYDAWMLSAYMDIQNVYNQRHTEGWSYNYDYSQKSGGGDLSFLTIFGLRAEF